MVLFPVHLVSYQCPWECFAAVLGFVLYTTVVGVSSRYDLGFFDGLITVPVQSMSVMYTVAPGGRGFNG